MLKLAILKVRIYTHHVRSTKYVANIEKLIKEEEESLNKLARMYEASSQPVTKFDKEINELMDKISILQHEKYRVQKGFQS